MSAPISYPKPFETDLAFAAGFTKVEYRRPRALGEANALASRAAHPTSNNHDDVRLKKGTEPRIPEREGA